MVKLRVNSKLSASTVLEVIVAMVIILVVLGLALTIYANVVRQSTPARQIRARMIIKKVMLSNQIQEEGTTENTESNWMVRSETHAYKEGTRLMEVHVMVSDDNGVQVAESRQIIIKNSK